VLERTVRLVEVQERDQIVPVLGDEGIEEQLVIGSAAYRRRTVNAKASSAPNAGLSFVLPPLVSLLTTGLVDQRSAW